MRPGRADGVALADLEPAEADQLAQRGLVSSVIVAQQTQLAGQCPGLERLVIRMSDFGENA